MSQDRCLKQGVCFIVVALTGIFLSAGFAHEKNQGDYESDGVGIPDSHFEYRMSFWRVPNDATGQTLVDISWRHGPISFDTQNDYGDPVYYQLMQDYTIDLTSYWEDHTKLPNFVPYPLSPQAPWNVNLQHPVWMVTLRNWLQEYFVLPHLNPRQIDTDFIKVWHEDNFPFPFPKVIMTLKKGYRWDGPSLNAPEWTGLGRVLAKPSSIMRSSMIHDAIYDLMRTRNLSYDDAAPVGAIPEDNELPGFYNRMIADCMFYMLSVQDRYYTNKALTDFLVIREFGRGKTHPGDPDTYPFWKHYAVADAGDDQQLNCASEAGVDVILDGSNSTFATSWTWMIDGTEVATGATPGIHLEPGTHTITLFTTDPDDLPGPFVYLFGGSDAVVITVSTECSMDICDLADFVSQWLSDQCNVENKFCRGLDRNGDGHLNLLDFADFSQLFLNEIE